MLIEWMAYATLLTAFVCGAALAAERAVAIWRGGQRFVWLAALVVSMVVPAALSVRRSAVADGGCIGCVTTTAPLPVLPSATSIDVSASFVRPPSLLARAQHPLVTLDPYLRGVWLTGSLLLLALFLRATVGLRRQRSRWQEIDLAGARLLLAPNAGPAVVGVLRPRVVVPQWALALDPAARELMLRHEAEHIRARDPHLLVVAAFALVLFPWNAGLWFIVRRLRLAVEVDCDQRVLRGSVRTRDYGMLLLTVGARHSASLPLAVSLAERRPFLERRIRAMTTPRPRKPLLASLAFMLVALAATTAASKAPRPAPFVMRTVTPQASRPVERPAIPAVVAAKKTHSAPVPATIPTAQVPSEVAPTPTTTPTSVPTATPIATAKRRGPEVPVDLLRAIVKMYHPNVFLGDSSANVVTIVLDHDLNYVYSSTDKMAVGDGKPRDVGIAYRKSFLIDAERDSVDVRKKLLIERAVAECKSGVSVGSSCEGLASRKLMMDTLGAAVDDKENAARYEKLLSEKFAAEAAQKARKLDFIDPEAIDAVEVRKFPAGNFGLYDVAIIVVVLKGSGDVEDPKAQVHYKFGKIF